MSILTKTLTIASGASASSSFNLRAANSDEGVMVQSKVLLGLIMPGALTGSSLTIQASLDGTTFYNLEDNSGNLMSLAFTASRWRTLEPTVLVGIPFFRLLSNGTEGSSRSIKVVVGDI